MSYSIHVDRSAVKFLQKLAKAEEVKIVNAIDSLANNPRPAGVKKLKGKFDCWRIRVGDYRVIYEIKDKACLILIIDIAYRKDVYRNF